MPPLRDRTDDIPLLARHFLDKAVKRHELAPKRLSPEALKALAQAPLKGNVRELENILEQAAVMSEGEAIGLADLSQVVPPASGGVRVMVPEGEDDLKKVLKQTARLTEEQVIRRVLKKTQGNRTQAAQRLGISRRALITKIQDLGL